MSYYTLNVFDNASPSQIVINPSHTFQFTINNKLDMSLCSNFVFIILLLFQVLILILHIRNTYKS